MSRPDAIVITDRPELLHPPEHPFGLALIPGDGPLPTNGFRGMWLIDPDCGRDTLSDPALDNYLSEKVPITLHAQKLRDLRPFLKRRAAFKLRGYRVEALP